MANQEALPGRSGFGPNTVAAKSHQGLDYCICAGCNPAITGLCMEGAEYFCSFAVPADCCKCSNDPRYFPDDCQTTLRRLYNFLVMKTFTGLFILGNMMNLARTMSVRGTSLRERGWLDALGEEWYWDPFNMSDGVYEVIVRTFTGAFTEVLQDERLTVDKWDAVTWMQAYAWGAYDLVCIELSELLELAKIEFTTATDYRTLYFFFTGTRDRVCVSDSLSTPASVEVCSNQFLAKTDVFLVPINFCMWTAIISACILAYLLYQGRTRNRKMVLCRIGITERYFQNLHNYSSLKQSDDKRDISGPIANTLDASKGVPAEMQTVLFYVLGGMSIRVPPTYGIFGTTTDVYRMMRGLNSNMRSTQFLRGPKSSTSGTPSGSPGAPPGLARLKIIWDRIARYGHHGYQVYLAGPRDTLRKLVGEEKLPLDLTPESAMVMTGAEAMPDARPPEGVIAGFVPNSHVTAPGPMLEPSTIHDPAGVSHSAESRTEPSKLPDGTFRTYNQNSETGKRFRKWANALYDLFTDDFIDKAFLKNYAETQLGEVPCGAFSKEEMQRFISEAQLLNSADSLPTRLSGGKRETIPKDGKDIRAVVDNTGQVFAIMNAAGKTMESMLFDTEFGIFRHTCIKHRPRPTVMGEMSQKMTRPECVAWEIDQTKMEAHVRSPGTLKVVIKLLERVMRRVRFRYSAQLTHIYDTRIKFDEKHGMRLSLKVNNVVLPGCEKTVTLKFKDFYLDSGWLLTSAGNFILEAGATTACAVDNPEHMFCKDHEGNVRISVGTFNHTYRGLAYRASATNPITGKVIHFKQAVYDSSSKHTAGELAPGGPGASRPLKPPERVNMVRNAKPVVYEGRFEGDDGAGQISNHVGNPGEPDEQKRLDGFAQQMRDNMAELGFDAKFKIIPQGRLEFIGLHARVEDGAVSATCPIVPAIKRTLGKLGANPQPNGRSTEQLAAIDAMRFYSLAEMFKGRVPAMHSLLTNCAERNARKVGKKVREQTISWNEYSDVVRAFGKGPTTSGYQSDAGTKMSLLDVSEKAYARATEVEKDLTPTASEQLKALETSLEVDHLEPAALAKLEILAQDCSNDFIDQMSCYMQLPAEMRAEPGL